MNREAHIYSESFPVDLHLIYEFREEKSGKFHIPFECE